MSTVGPTRFVHWLAGRDLRGRGAITELSHSLEALADSDFRLGDSIKAEAPLGVVTYTLSETGFLDAREASLRQLFGSGAPATPWPAIVGEFGSAKGAQCALATDLRIKKRSIPPDGDGFTKVALDFYLHSGGDAHDDAGLIAGGQRQTGAGNSSPFASDRYDTGAASANGGLLALMVDGIVWAGRTSLLVSFQHSTNGTAWVDRLATAERLTITSPATSGHTTVVLAGSVRQWLTASFTFTGTGAGDPSAKIIAAFKRF